MLILINLDILYNILWWKKYIKKIIYIVFIMKICLRCGKSFTKLKSHLSKAKPCEMKYLNIDRDILKEKYDEYYDQFVKIKNKKGDNNENNKIYECENCSNKFTQQSNYYRHKKHYCKKNNSTSNITNITNINGNNNNITNIENQQNINIIIQPFGNEKELSREEIINLLNNCINNSLVNDIIPLYIKEKWINREENRNINILDENRDKVEVYNGTWERKLLSNIIKLIRENSSCNIRKLLDDIKQKMEKNNTKDNYQNYKSIKIVDNYLNAVEDNEKKQKETDKKIKTNFINGRNKIRETKKLMLIKDIQINEE